MAKMRAMAIVEGADGATLELIEADRPKPQAGQILIKVMRAGVNRADLRRSQAHFTVTGPVIAGLEVSGRVVETGPDVSEFAPGDAVAAMAAGGYSEFVVADAMTALKVPEGVSFTSAAALAVWYQTAHDALVTAGRFEAGETVLITAARSGVGIAAAQCARALGAAKVMGTVRGGHASGLSDIGFDAILNGSGEDLAAQIRAKSDGTGADVTIDMIGSGMISALMDGAALGGRIVSVGRMGGFHDTVDFDKLALRRLSLVGVTFRTRSAQEKQNVRDAMLRDLAEPLSRGSIAPVIDSVFPLSDALAAQEHMRANRHFGKVVLSIGPED